MKKQIHILLLLLSAFTAGAQGFNCVAFVAALEDEASGAACATSAYGSYDEMLYGWESGDTPGGGWTGPSDATDADVATFDTAYDTSALTTGKPTGACNVALRTTLAAGGLTGFDTKYFDRGSTIAAGTAVDVRFYIYVQAAISGVGRTSIVVAGQSTDPTGGLSFVVEMRDNGGVNEVRAGSVTDSAWIALTANSWNLIHVHVDAVNSSSTVAVNGGAAEGFTSSATAGVRYVFVGACFASSTTAAGVWLTDLLAVNTP